MATVGVWQFAWAPYAYCEGVPVPLGTVWLPWGRGQSLWSRTAAVGVWPVPCASYGCRRGVAGPLGPSGRRETWSVIWVPSGRRGDVAGPLVPIWPLLGRGRSPGPRMATVEACPFDRTPYGCRAAWPVPRALYGHHGGVAIPLGTVWPPWGRGRSHGPLWLLWGVVGSLCFVWLPWGRCRSPRPRMAAGAAWPVFSALYGRRGGVAGPLGPSGRRLNVAGPLGSVWLSWVRDRSAGPRLAAVWAWPFP